MNSTFTIKECGDIRFLEFVCPGCGITHSIPVTGEKAWGFNDNVTCPTLTPSVKAQWPIQEGRAKYTCHFFLKDGVFEFLGDCTHEKAGTKFIAL